MVEAVGHYADFVQYAHCPEGGTAADATLPTMQEVQVMEVRDFTVFGEKKQRFFFNNQSGPFKLRKQT